MDLDTLVNAILGFGDMNALRAALKERAKVQIFQPFFNDGHSVATAEAATEKTKLEGQITAAQQSVAAAEKALKDWKDANPDTARIHEQYTAQIRELEQKHQTANQTREQQENAREVARSVKTLTAALIAKGVHPTHAKALVKDDDVTKRIQPYNGSVRVMQRDKDIAFAESDPDKAIELLADELKEGVEPEFLVSRVSRGSGRSTATGDAETRNGKDEALYEEIRQDVARKFGREKQDAEEAPARRGRGNAKDRLNSRLGLRTR